MSLTVLFDTIYESYCTISGSANFSFIYNTFNKKISISAKISRSQTDPK